MTIQEMLGDLYKDGMTVEEISEAITTINLVDPTKLPKSVSKDVFDKTASELSRLKKELKAIEEKNMTSDEKVQAELQKALEKQSQYQKELSKLKATEIFVKNGLQESDYEALMPLVINEDEEKTVTSAESFVKLLNAQKEALKTTLEAEFMKKNPKIDIKGGAGGGAITLETFKAMNWQERGNLKKSDEALYKELLSQEQK